MEDFFEFMEEIDFNKRYAVMESVSDFLEELNGYWGINHPNQEKVEKLLVWMEDLKDCIWFEQGQFLQTKIKKEKN